MWHEWAAMFFVSVQSFLALTCSSFLSCCSRLLSKSTKEPDAGEGGRRRANRVQAQDVSLGCGVMAEGQRPPQRKQQVMLMLHVWSSIHWWGMWKGFCGSHCPSYGHVFCLWPLWCPQQRDYINGWKMHLDLPENWLLWVALLAGFASVCSSSFAKRTIHIFVKCYIPCFFPCCVYYRCR